MTDTIELVGGDYEHVLGLAGVHDGVDIRYCVGQPNNIFLRMLTEQCYEACEFSLANYIMLKDRGADWLHAIPVFPYRAFRHSTLWVRQDSALRDPGDLPGKRIGVPDFSMTAAVWSRGILSDQYGVRWQNLQWVVSGPQRFSVPRGVRLESLEGDLEGALLDGQLDALLVTHTADQRKPAAERKLRPLIADPQVAEEAYLRDFGIYPINHVIVMRTDTLSRLPQLPAILYRAYSEAKEHAYKRRLGTTLLPWGARYWTRMFDKFGGDPLPYGLTETNRKVVARLGSYLRDQMLIAREPDLDRLFMSI